MTFVKRYGGYSRDRRPRAATTGYVASDEITHLSPQEISEEDAALLDAARLRRPPWRRTNAPGGPDSNYSIPPEAARDTVLPVPDASPAAAKPTPNPMFRY